MQLFDYKWSGNCHKVKLFASIVSLPLEVVPIDLLAAEHMRPPLSELNPLCELPVLIDGDLVLRDSAAILIYMARRGGHEDWYPTQASDMALVSQWFGTAAANLNFGPALARGAEHFGYPADRAMTSRISERLFVALERHLLERTWLELGRATLADIAMFPYLAAASEGGFDLTAFPALRRWIKRIEGLPGFIAMPKVLRP